MKKLLAGFVLALIVGVVSMAYSIMPVQAVQGAMGVYPAQSTQNFFAPLRLDSNNLLTVNSSGTSSSLGLSAAGAVKTSAGRIGTIVVTTAGSTAGAIYDSPTTTASAALLIATIPATIGVIKLDMPVTTGIWFVPGTSQVVSVSYN
jgi:hypothetical protein